MHKLIKTLNKFNGNICFAGSTDYGDFIFECSRDSEVLVYAYSTKLITDVCVIDSSSYGVAFSDGFIGKFDGALNETYINTGISNVDKIVRDSTENYYILNKTLNQLIKYDSGIIWTFDLPDYNLKNDGNICLRESDNSIIYNNNSSIYIVRDDDTLGVLCNSLDISGSGNIRVAIGDEFLSSYQYIRSRTVDGIEQSSSSSSSSL